VLIVSAVVGAQSLSVTGTYNGVAMTTLQSSSASGPANTTAVLYLLNPDEGAHNVVLSFGAGTITGANGASVDFSGSDGVDLVTSTISTGITSISHNTTSCLVGDYLHTTLMHSTEEATNPSNSETEIVDANAGGTGTWRFTVGYRNADSSNETMGWTWATASNVRAFTYIISQSPSDTSNFFMMF
jgi:hypothetical protein